MGSEWQPIAGFEGCFEVSRAGEVRRTTGRIMNQYPNQFGYALVRLSAAPKRVAAKVHRLVAEAFIPNPKALPFVNHINHVRDDNRAENLEWCTQRDNLAHARKHGRMPDDYWTGRRSPNAALSDEQVANIRQRYAAGGISHQALASEVGISKRAIGRLLSGETYQKART